MRRKSAPAEGAGQHGEHVSASDSGAAKVKVVLVDDDERVRRSTFEVLSDDGHEVTESSGAGEALAVFAENDDTDPVITDLVMPGGSGSYLTEALRTIRPDTPVSIITGYADDAVAIPPNVEVLYKPFRPAHLLRAVAESLNKLDYGPPPSTPRR